MQASIDEVIEAVIRRGLMNQEAIFEDKSPQGGKNNPCGSVERFCFKLVAQRFDDIFLDTAKALPMTWCRCCCHSLDLNEEFFEGQKILSRATNGILATNELSPGRYLLCPR